MRRNWIDFIHSVEWPDEREFVGTLSNVELQHPKVFLVDDDDAVRRSLTGLLERRGIGVESFASAEAFLDAFSADVDGCLVLDLTMPGMTGLELQQELAKSAANIPIIFITGNGNIPQSVQAIKSGAIDFLEKPFEIDMLLERIDEALAETAMRRAQEEYCSSVRDRFDALTDREQDVMRLLIADAGASSKSIAATLGISHRTVDHHRARIMEKTQARSVTELARLAAWAGIIEVQPELA